MSALAFALLATALLAAAPVDDHHPVADPTPPRATGTGAADHGGPATGSKPNAMPSVPDTPAPPEAPAAGPSRAESSRLSLERYLARFLQVDPEMALRGLHRDIARTRADQSRDRLRLSAELNAPITYDLYALPQNQLLHVGGVELGQGALVLDDSIGGALRLNANGRLITDPRLKSGGQTAGVSLGYALPLWRNLGGRLYELEAKVWDRTEETHTQEIEVARLARCAAGIELYVAAWELQELEAVWQDLLAHKERIAKRTARDFGRRLVTRLDSLAARSDWLSAQQRHVAFLAHRDEVRASFGSYLREQTVDGDVSVETGDTDETSAVLDDPAGALAELPAALPPAQLREVISDHPTLRTLAREQEAIEAELAAVERRYVPEIFVGPSVGVQYMSHLLMGLSSTGNSSYVPVTNAFALLSVSASVPIIEPTPSHERAVVAYRRDQIQRQRREAVRLIDESARVAIEVVDGVDARLALTEEKLEVIKRQINEAGALYGQGRLEFQDYLQHWAIYEEARFEQLALLRQRWIAQAHLMQSLGKSPTFCQGGE